MNSMKQIGWGVFGLLVLTNTQALGHGLKLDKASFAPGEEINVHFSASSDYAENAWVGIIPAHIEHGSEAVNDGHDLTYQYLKKRTSGVLKFQALAKAGSYDFRMHDTDSNGNEVASVSFSVGGQLLRLDKTTFAPGEEINVHFNASGDYADNAWIGIIPAHIEHGSEAVNDGHDLTYQYLKKRTSGVLKFQALAKAGSYDFRMHDTDSNGNEVASVSFIVQ